MYTQIFEIRNNLPSITETDCVLFSVSALLSNCRNFLSLFQYFNANLPLTDIDLLVNDLDFGTGAI